MSILPGSDRNVGINTANHEVDGDPKADATALIAAPTPIAAPAPVKIEQQWRLGAIYLIALLSCFGMALHWSGKDFKIAMAWVVAGIIASQIVVDLGRFSTPEAKVKFSVVFRSAAGIIALIAAYWL